MQTNFKIQRERAFMKKFTVLLFELTKNKHRINGFISIKGRKDFFGHLIYAFNIFNFKNDYLTIFNDLEDNVTLEDVRAQSDFCIYFRHIGNADELDIKLIKHDENFVEMIFFTTEPEVTWEDQLPHSFSCRLASRVSYLQP